MNNGKIELGEFPLIAGVVSGNISLSPDELANVDVFELRYDMFDPKSGGSFSELLKTVREKYGKPIILTVRAKREGGEGDLDDDERCAVYLEFLPRVEMVDIELSSRGLLEKVNAERAKTGTKLIVSHHNFDTTPDDETLAALVKECWERGADVAKIAAKANSADDVARLFAFTRENKSRPIVTISMGSAGAASRVFNTLAGSCVTYGYVDRASAPGQMSVFEIVEHLKIFFPGYSEHVAGKNRSVELV